MDVLHEFFSRLYHFDELIRWGGYTVLIIIVFAETGLLAGFFLPGDSLLVTAGVLCALHGVLNYWVLLISLIVAAVLGDSVGYWVGASVGPRLYQREDSFFFKKKHLLRTREFFQKYGNKTIVLARFVPIIRTFAPTVAGVGEMNYRQFLTYNVIGGAAWVSLTVSGGYWLGRSIPNIEKKVHWVILIVIFASFLPIAWEMYAHRRHDRASVKPSV